MLKLAKAIKKVEKLIKDKVYRNRKENELIHCCIEAAMIFEVDSFPLHIMMKNDKKESLYWANGKLKNNN